MGAIGDIFIKSMVFNEDPRDCWRLTGKFCKFLGCWQWVAWFILLNVI
jgi:hypothetical protein